MDVLFVSGGSVGHLAPAVAIWEAMKEARPDAYAAFICADRPDEREFLRVRKLQALPMPLPKKSVILPVLLFRQTVRSIELLKTIHPSVVMSKGGILSVPVCIAAWFLKIPIVLQESDAVMGWANWAVSKIATKVCLGFRNPQLESDDTIFTGNPVRPAMRNGSREEGLRITGLSGSKPILLVMGGSQGAATLNEWVKSNLKELLSHCDVVHITGRGKEGAVKEDGYWSAPFLQEELAHLYAIGDLAVCRAGAGTIGELAATGVPAVLVPLPGLAHDHQTSNARVAAASEGCVVSPQETIDHNLFPLVTSLLANQPKRAQMSARIRTLDTPLAARQIADVVVQCVASKGHSA